MKTNKMMVTLAFVCLVGCNTIAAEYGSPDAAPGQSLNPPGIDAGQSANGSLDALIWSPDAVVQAVDPIDAGVADSGSQVVTDPPDAAAVSDAETSDNGCRPGRTLHADGLCYCPPNSVDDTVACLTFIPECPELRTDQGCASCPTGTHASDDHTACVGDAADGGSVVSPDATSEDVGFLPPDAPDADVVDSGSQIANPDAAAIDAGVADTGVHPDAQVPDTGVAPGPCGGAGICSTPNPGPANMMRLDATHWHNHSADNQPAYGLANTGDCFPYAPDMAQPIFAVNGFYEIPFDTASGRQECAGEFQLVSGDGQWYFLEAICNSPGSPWCQFYQTGYELKVRSTVAGGLVSDGDGRHW